MLIDLVALATMLLLMRLSAVLLYVWMGVCGCEWTSSLSVLRMGIPVLAFKNNALSSASAVGTKYGGYTQGHTLTLIPK